MKEIAVLMAAGLGSRMRPLTDRIAKPLVEVKGVPLIETVLVALQERGVAEIYVVVGYKKEQFEYLTTKYSNLHLIENKVYQTKNNVSSIAAAADVMGTADCFVCEADLFIPKASLLCRPLERSGYFGKMVQGVSDDWVFDFDGEKITSIHKCGTDCYNMVGVSFFKQEDAAKIAKACKIAVDNPADYQLFWDDVVNRMVNDINLTIHEVNNDEIVECDTVEDLEKLQ